MATFAHPARDPDAPAARLQSLLRETGPATSQLPTGVTAPITVVGTPAIRETFDQGCLQQAINARLSPGVTDVVLNPDAHVGYGAPVGCVMVSPTHIYPGPVGVDIKCSMSFLQLDLPEEAVVEKRVRRALIEAICERTPTGAGRGQRHVPKARRVDESLGRQVVLQGASRQVCQRLGIPEGWSVRCEDAQHRGHDGTEAALERRLELLETQQQLRRFAAQVSQLGSYGGGNHFGECEVVRLRGEPEMQAVAATFGLRDGHLGFLSHCGSRGFGHSLATAQFRTLKAHFETWGTPMPAQDPQLVYAPLGTPQADDYLDDMALGANFATVNHLLINALVLEAFQEVFPGTEGDLVYLISHNIARQEVLDEQLTWVHRKGATRAFPAGHHALRETPFAQTGHPILLPGSPTEGSAIMVARAGAASAAYSVNHGAGRALGRKQAFRVLDQQSIDQQMEDHDILSNCRRYPRDEAPAAYKDFNEVLRSVQQADLAQEVARLQARFVIKDASEADD